MFRWFTNLFKTDTEIKRDDYYELYQRLTDAITEHDRKVSEVNSAYSSYAGAVPNLSKTDIPSSDFESCRDKKDGELKRYFYQDQDKRSSLVTAKDQAYERYIYYRNQAAQETEERERKEREELEAIFKTKG